MTPTVAQRWDLKGHVASNAAVSAGLLRLDVMLPHPVAFLPGQFAMLNLTGTTELVFRRPFSILAIDGPVISFLYRVAGRGTALLAELRSGDAVRCLAPLGRAFPAPIAGQPVLLVAGGVGLPPLWAWWVRHRRPQDLAFFGGRDGADVPWGLLGDAWRVSVDTARDLPAGRSAYAGLVTELCVADLAQAGDAGPFTVLACGPTPLLRAAAALAAERTWPCYVSVEEHMGCGYGVCKGCVVPVRDGATVRNATSCDEGPVFDASRLVWDRFQPGGHA